jgi:hypothetical protein
MESKTRKYYINKLKESEENNIIQIPILLSDEDIKDI